MSDCCTAYAQAVVAGEIPACRFVILACERHLRDIDAGVWVWDPKAVELAIRFFPLLRHYKGEFAGKQFQLEPWQGFIVGCVFGWKDAAGRRRFREAYIEIPRKNGKSTLAGGVGLLLFFLEKGGEVYTVATKEEQAKIVWNDARVMVKGSPSLRKRVRSLHNTMHFDAQECVFKPLGRDSKTLDGLNPSGAIGDEVHAWPDRQMYDVMDSGFGARAQPLFFLITTAGTNQNSFCYQHRKHSIDVISSVDGYQDDRLFVFIATIDEGDDPFDESTWHKANPNLGVSKSVEYMRDQASRAKLIPSKKADFLTKQLDVWVEAAESWIPLERWDACRKHVDWETMGGARCYAGLDLATSTDLAAAVLIFPLDVGFLCKPRFWLPERTLEDNQRMRSKAVLSQLRRWVKEGYIELTPGDWIDYDVIRGRLLQDAATFQLIELGYDPHNAGNLPNELMSESLETVAVKQGFSQLGSPSREFERLILAGQMHHDGNPVLRWMIGNAVTIQDMYGNIRPDKRKSHEKIDGVVAAIMALMRAMAGEGTDQESIYESQEIRIY